MKIYERPTALQHLEEGLNVPNGSSLNRDIKHSENSFDSTKNINIKTRKDIVERDIKDMLLFDT
jgi:hypothetical protein